jgi:MFS family permease
VWGSVGYVLVSLLTGLLLSSRGSSGPMTREALTPLFTYGPLLFFALATLTLFLPDPRREQTTSAATTPDEVLSEETADESRVCAHNLQRYLRAHFLYIFAWCGAGAYLSLYLKGLGATPLWITVIFAAGVLCEALVMTRVGKLSDRLGRRPLMAVAFAVMPLRLLLYIPAAAIGPVWALGVQTLHGINFGIMAAVAITFVNDLCSEHNRGATQARLAATGGLAAALGPAAGGWISQSLGLQWNFAIMAMVAAVGAAQFLWKVRESIPVTDPLHRRGPAQLRPVLRVLCIPGGWLVRASRRATASRSATATRPDDTVE